MSSKNTNQESLPRKYLKRETAKRRLFAEDHDDPVVDPKADDVEAIEVTQQTTSMLTTPTKKRRLDNGVRSYFSPKGQRIVTPEKDEAEIETPVKSTSAKKTKRPEDDTVYAPTYIHKNLGYQRRGQASLGEKLKKTFALVGEHFVIPEDFEQNKFDYGPQSGTCFEERVVQAYNLSLLEAKDESAVAEICSHCVKMGHKKTDCPDLI